MTDRKAMDGNIIVRERIGAFLRYFLMTVIALVVLIPFLWMVLTSLKTEAETLHTPTLIFPAKPMFSNYPAALKFAPFLTYFANTILVGALVLVFSTIVSVLAAYAFSWMEFRGKDLLFFVVLGSMMIPQEMMIITNFMTVAKLGWINTYQALVLPYCVNAMNIFLLRQNMKQIPQELFTAARIDGLGHFKFLQKVVLPIAKPTVLTTMILALIWIWNTYAWPSLVTTKDALRLVSNGLNNAFTQTTEVRYELQMAASTMVTVPLIALFLAFRKQIFSGMKMGGIKG